MNNLHKFVEAVKNEKVFNSFDCVEFPEMIEQFSKLSGDAVAFCMGDVSGLDPLKIIDDHIRLPYDVCWFEADAGSLKVGALVWNARLSARILDRIPLACSAVFIMEKGVHIYVGSFVYLQDNDLSVSIGHPYVNEKESKRYAIAGYAAESVARFLSALHCKNVIAREQPAPVALNKARARKGKCRIFSTWTLSVDIPGTKSDCTTGTGHHAPPRVHLRRGHPREYKPGLYTWVQPCVVGSKEAGMIHKDYFGKVRATPPAAAA